MTQCPTDDKFLKPSIPHASSGMVSKEVRVAVNASSPVITGFPAASIWLPVHGKRSCDLINKRFTKFKVIRMNRNVSD